MKDAIIREITKEELTRCAEIVICAFNEISGNYGLTPDEDTVRLLTHLQDDLLLKAKMFGTFVGDIQVGFVEIDSKDEEIFEIKLLCVLPQYQNQGLGQALLEKATEGILDEGGRGIVCAIINENVRLKQWLKGNGFYEEVSGSLSGVPCTICLLQRNMANPCDVS